MSAWTPGPWEYSASDNVRHAVVSPPVDGEADIGPWFTAIFSCADDAVETANARLAAAAPEIYEVLSSAPGLPSSFDQYDRFASEYRTFREKRSAALAKARGEQSL